MRCEFLVGSTVLTVTLAQKTNDLSKLLPPMFSIAATFPRQPSTVLTLEKSILFHSRQLQRSRSSVLDVSTPGARHVHWRTHVETWPTASQTLHCKSRVQRPLMNLANVRRIGTVMPPGWTRRDLQIRTLHSTSGVFAYFRSGSQRVFDCLHYAYTVIRHGGITRPEPGKG